MRTDGKGSVEERLIRKLCVHHLGEEDHAFKRLHEALRESGSELVVIRIGKSGLHFVQKNPTTFGGYSSMCDTDRSETSFGWHLMLMFLSCRKTVRHQLRIRRCISSVIALIYNPANRP